MKALMNVANSIITIIILVGSALVSITVHEAAHGFAAYKMGDDTAKIYGRMTLNPFKHIDIIGALCLILFRFGWAKPVPVNSFNFTNRKKGIIIVSLAGPFANLILSFVARLILSLIIYYGVDGNAMQYLSIFTSYLTFTNLGLAVFNLIPIPPLDGSKVLAEFLNGGTKYRFESVSRYSPIILLLLLWAPGISNIFSAALNFFVNRILMGYDILIKLIIGVV